MLTHGFCKAPRCQFCACFLAVAHEGRDSPRFGDFHRLGSRLVLHLGQDLLLHERLAKPLDTTQPGLWTDVSSVPMGMRIFQVSEDKGYEKEIPKSRWSETRIVICRWNWRSTHWHKTFSMHLCFRSASCGILSDLGFQGPPRNFERISDSKKNTDFLFWCFFSLVSTCFLPFFPSFTFDISVICSKWNLKVVLRPRTVSGPSSFVVPSIGDVWCVGPEVFGATWRKSVEQGQDARICKVYMKLKCRTIYKKNSKKKGKIVPWYMIRTRIWQNCTKTNVDLDVCDITKFL